MKRISYPLILATILSLVLVSTSSAQYAGYSWSTAYQVVNMGDANTTIVIDYYDVAGVVQTTARKTFTDVAPGSSRLVMQFVDDPNLTSGRYSAVITADQPIAAIANQQMVPSGATSYNPVPPFSTYSGESQGSTQITLPSVMYNWYNYYTDIYFMNVGTASATNVDITYIPGVIGGSVTGASGVTDLNNTIARFATLEKSQATMTSLGAPSGTFVGRFFGSAVVTSDQPIIVVVNQHNPTAWKLMTYNGFHEGSTEIAAPVHMRGYYGYYSTMMVANPSASETAHVRITYNPDTSRSVALPGSTNASFWVEYDINPQTTMMRYDGPSASDDQSDLDDPPHAFSRFYGGVLVESTNAVPVVVQVNVEAIQTGDDQAGSYNGIPISSATPDIVVPVILADYYGYYTNLVVQNVTAVPGTCTITYTSDSTYSAVPNHSASYDHALPANGTFTVYEGRKGSLEIGDINHDSQWRSGSNRRFIGAASIHCTVNAVAFVNEEKDVVLFDSMYTFNTFNK